MTRIRILSYRQGSRGASALAAAVGGRVLRLQGSTFRPRATDTIINWGNTDAEVLRRYAHCRVLNGGDLRRATNKLSFFRRMFETGNGGIIPQFWERAADVPNEAFADGGIVVCRTNLAGHSGDGIVLARSRQELVPCSLYVKYVKKQEEYRVHVGMRDGQASIIAVQRKARRRETPDDQVNWQIRNLAGGFIFAREGFTTPDPVLVVAQRALHVAGLDFGAVDVVWNARRGEAFVLEINTAPGLEGQTVEDYRRFFAGGN